MDAELRVARQLLDVVAVPTAPTSTEALAKVLPCRLRSTRHWSAVQSSWQPAIVVRLENAASFTLAVGWTRKQ